MSRLFPVCALAAALLLPSAADAQEASAPAPMNPAERAALHREIRSYILDHPEIILEAINILEQRREAETAATDSSRVAANAGALFDDGHSWVGGNPEGDITVVEFFDYRCGFCKRAHPVMERLLEEDGNIRLVLKEFPILGPESVMASRMAMAALAVDPSGYRGLNDALMEHRGALTEVAAYRIAKEQGYDIATLKAREDDPDIDRWLQQNYALAEALGLQGTPSFVIGDRIVRGFLSYEDMAATVAAARGATQ